MPWRARTDVQHHGARRARRPQLKRDPLGVHDLIDVTNKLGRFLTEDELTVLRLVQDIWGDLNTPEEVITTDDGGVGLFVKASDGTSPLFVHLTNLGAWYADGSLSYEKLREWVSGPGGADA